MGWDGICVTPFSKDMTFLKVYSIINFRNELWRRKQTLSTEPRKTSGFSEWALIVPLREGSNSSSGSTTTSSSGSSSNGTSSIVPLFSGLLHLFCG